MANLSDLKITEKDFAAAVNSRSKRDIYTKMSRAKIGIAGLGGLGSNVAAALARMGAGKLVIADFDKVELSNINRQIYAISHIGKNKTAALSEILREINPFCEISAFSEKINEKNAPKIFGECDVICECFDKAEEKSALVNSLLENTRAVVIAASGLSGIGLANEIKTKKISERFFVCGDLRSGIESGEGLSAARVLVCAGHQASAAAEKILEEK